MQPEDVLLGQEYKDVVTGYKGIATSKHEYMNGCTRYTLEAKMDKDGKIPDSLAVDIQQLRPTANTRKIKAVQTKTGGPPARGAALSRREL